jgi:uncharacterized protein YjbJ (UPF0337 family)
MASATKTRVKGKLNELAGKAKAKVGKALGNEQMEAEGLARELKGKATQEIVKAGERARGRVEEVVGKLKKSVGKVLDNEQMQAEGALKRLKGKTRQRVNKR